jgi:Protein of unknown function (DUF2637)
MTPAARWYLPPRRDQIGTLPGGATAAGSRADTCIRAAAGVTVVGLAGIAGAISYSHMRLLAAEHGETGWQAHAFPLSVDGIEIVASLVLLADRHIGRRSGWLPWAAFGDQLASAGTVTRRPPRPQRTAKARRLPTPCHSQRIAHLGACRKTRVVP